MDLVLLAVSVLLCHGWTQRVCLLMASRERFPLRLDPHQAQKIQPNTLSRYRSAALQFVHWCNRCSYRPGIAEDWDDLLVEFENDEQIKKANFELLVAAVEFYFPRFKGRLCAARAVLVGWAVAHQVRHHVPLCSGPAALVADP